MRFRHLEAWQEMGADWLQHAMVLASMLPPGDQLVLDGWTGSLDAENVAYDEDADQKWQTRQAISIVIDGEAIDRATADALREALVETQLYSASSSGADTRSGNRLNVGFTYRLRTTDGLEAVAEEGGEP